VSEDTTLLDCPACPYLSGVHFLKHVQNAHPNLFAIAGLIRRINESLENYETAKEFHEWRPDQYPNPDKEKP
jgi:hypothetical protein